MPFLSNGIVEDVSISSEVSVAVPDYEQRAIHHRALLILFSSPAHSTQKFNLQGFKSFGGILDGQSRSRSLLARFLHIDEYPKENNAWSDFQMHRSVLGFLSISNQIYSSSDLENAISRHNNDKSKYSSTILDSRLIVLGMPCPPISPLSTNKNRVIFCDEKELEETLQDFVSVLFWVLESKRLNVTPFLLIAPFEKKAFIGLDLESRYNKKRMSGRFRKYLGDLCLLLDLFSEANTHYESAIDILRGSSDWLWLANALEGLVVTASLHSSSSLSFSDVIDKYREIVIHLSKYRHAGFIEIESSVKAVSLLKEEGKFLLAAEFLQNIVFINWPMREEDKIKRFLALSNLYDSIGFKRKSAFFRRVAALRYAGGSNPNWLHSYKFLLQASEGYILTSIKGEGENIEKSERMTKGMTDEMGWPELQIQILYELVGTSFRGGDIISSLKQTLRLLETFCETLSSSRRFEMMSQLQTLSSKISSSLPSSSSICFRHLPSIFTFSILSLPSHLLPVIKKKETNSESPFLFTPIVIETSEPKYVTWIQNESSSVNLSFKNTFSSNVTLENLQLVSRGVKFKNEGISVEMNSSLPLTSVVLSGTPLEVGQLVITGISCSLFGIPSFVHFSESKGPLTTIQVSKALPLLHVDLTSEVSFLYNGEELVLKAEFTNVGCLPISFASLSLLVSEFPEITSDFENGPFFSLDSISSSVISKHIYLRNFFMSSNVKKSFTVTLSVLYGTSSSESQRTLDVKRSFDLHSSIEVLGMDVFPSEFNNQCLLVLDLKNSISISDVVILYGLEEKVLCVLEPKENAKVLLRVNKLHQRKTSEFLNQFPSLLSLKWRLESSSSSSSPIRSGLIISPLKELKCSQSQMKLLTLSPLTWKLFLNESPLENDTPLSLQVGVPFHLKVHLEIIGKDNEEKEEQKAEIEIHSLSWRAKDQCFPFLTSSSIILVKQRLIIESFLERTFVFIPLQSGSYEIDLSVSVNENENQNLFLSYLPLTLNVENH